MRASFPDNKPSWKKRGLPQRFQMYQTLLVKAGRVKAVLDYGLEEGNITDSEAATALDCLQSFLSFHPGFAFLSPKERWRRGTQQSEAERKMWSAIQPVLDKAQEIPPQQNEE